MDDLRHSIHKATTPTQDSVEPISIAELSDKLKPGITQQQGAPRLTAKENHGPAASHLTDSAGDSLASPASQGWQSFRIQRVDSFGFREDDLDDLVEKVKAYLRGATKTHLERTGEEPHQNTSMDVYSFSDSHVEELVYNILRAASQMRQIDDSESSCTSRAFTDPGTLSRGSSRAVKSLHPMAPTAEDPAMTTSSSQTVITAAAGAPIEDPTQTENSTTATSVSKDNLTRVSWPSDPGPQPVEPLASRDSVGIIHHLDESPDMRRSDCATKAESKGKSVNKTVVTASDRQQGLLNDSDSAALNKDSTSVMANGENADDLPEEQRLEPAERRTSVLGKIRKKTIQLGQTMGSFVNGAYLNADYRPRRPSSIFRIKAILDRDPPRPKQDPAAFFAMTGAQPITPVDFYTARQPGPCMS